MRLLVFQHIDCEHPGSLRAFLQRDQIDWHPINLHRGDEIPDLQDYDALWVMGGPMDVWDVEEFPWLVKEKAAIRKWVSQLDKPYLGLCLGHQLLADALGGTCGPQKPPEIGVLDVQLTQEGVKDPIFNNLPEKQKCLQWHSVCVAQPPENSTVLAYSDICSVQAMRVGDHAWSMQYHIEIEPDTVDNWGKVPAYEQALNATLGETGMQQLNDDAKRYMDDFLGCSSALYENFKALVD